MSCSRLGQLYIGATTVKRKWLIVDNGENTHISMKKSSLPIQSHFSQCTQFCSITFIT